MLNRIAARLLALLLFLSVIAPVPAMATRDADVDEAVRAFEAIITGNAHRFTYTDAEQVSRVKANPMPRFQPVLTVFDLEITCDENDPDAIRYSCTIPGAAGVALTMLTGYFYRNMDSFCPRVPVSGTLRFTDGTVGRRLSAESPDNPFHLLLNLRYLTEDELVEPVEFKLFGNYSSDEFPYVLEALTKTVAKFYGEMLGTDDYYESTAKADMETIVENLDILTPKAVSFYEAIAGDYLDLSWSDKIIRSITTNVIWLWGLGILASLVVVPLFFLLLKGRLQSKLSLPKGLKPCPERRKDRQRPG